MTDDLSIYAATLLANQITVRFPRLDAREYMSSGGVKVPRLSNRLFVLLRLLGIRMDSSHAGHHRFLYRMDADLADRWVIHMFFVDKDALSLVASFTTGLVSPGEPASFHPHEFIEQRLEHLKSWIDSPADTHGGTTTAVESDEINLLKSFQKTEVILLSEPQFVVSFAP